MVRTVHKDTPTQAQDGARQETWTVGDVSALTRVSVRTLHHYDAVGLLRPSGRSGANYRLYTAADLARLWRVLTYRELGFGLSEIGRLLDAPREEQVQALHTQLALLREQQRRTQATLDAVQTFLRAAERGEEVNMSSKDLQEVFGDFDHSQYEEEARERWGDTDAYRQSAERTRRYTKQDWEAIQAEGEALTARYVTLMDAGAAPQGPEAQQVASDHRAYFTRWFYDCSPELFRNLARMWVEDERFTRNIDKARPGLAAYQSAAALAWAQEAEG